MLDLGNAGLIQEPHQQLTLNKEAAVPKCVNTFTRSSIMFIITRGNIMLMVPISHHLWSLWQEGDCSHYPCQIRTLDSSFIHHHNRRAHQVDTVNQKAISFILGRETGFHISLSPRFTAQSLASGTDTSERSCLWKNSTMYKKTGRLVWWIKTCLWCNYNLVSNVHCGLAKDCCY